MTTLNIVKATKESVLDALNKALSDCKVASLVTKNEQAKYDYISNSSEVELQYKPTILSPKKFFFPQEEVLLEYTADGKVSPKIDSEPLILFGLRPCDLNALKILDQAFADGHGDPNYLAKREKTTIIGIDCKGMCDDDAFCYNVNSHYVDDGFDAMLHEDGDQYVIEIATKRGKDFFDKYCSTELADQQALDETKKVKEQAFADKKPFENLAQFPETFEKNKNHEVWENEGKRCLSCGSCIMVCPTCYCFDVADELALSLKKGERLRRWDACMLSSFAEVAGGENFRESATARLHHRIDRKFNFLMKKYKQAVCVGCGRCVRACLADISPRVIAQEIIKEQE